MKISMNAALLSTFLVAGISAPGLADELGGWSTAGVVDGWADFVVPGFDAERLFLLSCTEIVDDDLVEYMVVADGRDYPITFSEGGTVLVESHGPNVQQITPGTVRPCRVEILPDGADQSIGFSFEARHAVPELVLALNPDRPRRFRIDFDYQQLPDLPACSNVKLRPFVNGKPVVTADGREVALHQGTSFWGKGHTVIVSTVNDPMDECPTNAPIRGRIALHAD